MTETLRISLVQMTSIDDVDHNLQTMLRMAEEAVTKESAQLICFPENCLYMRLLEGEKVKGLSVDDPAFGKLLEFSKKHKVTLHLGSVPLRAADKLENASVTIGAEEVRASYSKIHLFDIELTGQKAIRESDVFHHGVKESILNFGAWHLGQSICYDVRFAELYSRYAQSGVDAILVPSAFLVTTGEAHWEVLLRARAIESQCYILAAAQAGTHQSARGMRKTYGHSMIIDPWGKVLKVGSADQEQILSIELHKEVVQKVRQQIPMARHRRFNK